MTLEQIRREPAAVDFVRPVTAGDTGRLRCNKYSPPYLILCSNKVEP